MAEEDDEQDVYVAQLRQLFETSDTSGTGFLCYTDLHALCTKLNVQDQAPRLLKTLFRSDRSSSVGFQQFKDAFVAVLSETVDDSGSSVEVEYEEEYLATDVNHTCQYSDDRHVMKGAEVTAEVLSGCVSGENYVPTSSTVEDLDDEVFLPSSDPDASHVPAALSSSYNRPCSNCASPGVNAKDNGECVDATDCHLTVPTIDYPRGWESYEAEGEKNQKIAEMEKQQDPLNEEAHLRDIWRQLRVGDDGYLRLKELATVCEHIGMQETDHQELEELFEKLDVDGDGRVSFQEFLDGLFQHGEHTTPSSTPGRSRSNSRHRRRCSLPASPSDRPHNYISTATGFFSLLDADHTGCALPSAVIDLWENLGVPQGADILEYLQFDVNSKIILTDLWDALEHELHSVETENAAYQAAIFSYQHELKHLRISNDQTSGERDKLQSDLNEANNRITLLVREVDERHASLERNNQKEFLAMETKYQEQLRLLQIEIDQERSVLLNQSATQQRNLEGEIERLKVEEAYLRDRLSKTQKELEKLEKEICEMAVKCADLEDLTSRQQRELETAAEYQRRLEELESNRDIYLDEQHRSSEQKLKLLQIENQELKDLTDELTTEVAELQTCLSGRSRRASSPNDSFRRRGSLLSDYDISLQDRTTGGFSDNSSEEDLPEFSTVKTKRKVVLKHSEEFDSDTDSSGGEKMEAERLQGKDNLNHDRKLTEQRILREKQCLENGHRMEILQLKEEYARDKDELTRSYTQEKEQIKDKLEAEHRVSLRQQEEDLLSRFESQKKDLLSLANSEKQFLEQKSAAEKAVLAANMREEYMQEIQSKLKEEREKSASQLEKAVSEERSHHKNSSQREADLELKLRLQEEELRDQFEKEKQNLLQQFNTERTSIEEKNRSQIKDCENMFSHGLGALEGRLKEDFYSLLTQHKEELQKQEIDKLLQIHEQEKQRITRQAESEQERIASDHLKEKQILDEKVRELEETVQREREAGRVESRNIHTKRWDNPDHSDTELPKKIQSQPQGEFAEQMGKMKGSFADERSMVESRLQLPSAELQQSNSSKGFRDEESDTGGQSNKKHKQSVNNCQESETAYKKDTFVKENCDNKDKSSKHISVPKSEEVTSRVAKQPPETPAESDVGMDRDKAILEAIDRQRSLLIQTGKQLHQQIAQFGKSLHSANENQPDQDGLVQEKQLLQETLQKLDDKMQQLFENSFGSDHSKCDSNDWESERGALLDQLELAGDQLAAANTALSLASSEHVREMQVMREKVSDMVHLKKYNALNCKLIESERKVQELHAALELRAAETSKLLVATQEDNQKTLRKWKEKKEETETSLTKTRSLLADQVHKLKQELKKSAKTSLLVKDLYVENAQLMRCLEVTEKREKETQGKLNKLEEKYEAIRVLLHRICPVALQ